MKWHTFRPDSLATAILLALAACAAVSAPRAARAQDTPSWNKTPTAPKPAPAKPTPKPRPAPKPVRRAPAPEPARPATPPLTVQFRILKVNENNSQVEVSPVTVFNRGDRLRIAVKSSEDVYLHVIHQQAPNQSGRVFIPDSQFNSGQNFIPRGREFIVPSGCPPGGAPSACSYLVDGPAGQEFFTLIFSRGPSVNLLEGAAAAAGSIRPQDLDAYMNAAGQKVDASGRGDTIFSRQVRNLNPRSNDRVAVRYVLNKKG